jgi:hypothetical protein
MHAWQTWTTDKHETPNMDAVRVRLNEAFFKTPVFASIDQTVWSE